MLNTKLLGKWGEALAAEYFQTKGYKITGMSYQTRFGEIDIIAENREYIVFVEVKLRKNACFAEAREYVDEQKIQRIVTTAEIWLSENETKKQTGQEQTEQTEESAGQTGGDGITIINPGITTEEISGGGYVETETIVDKKTSGGWIITYQTVITRTYDASGKLVSTKKTGPTEISKVQSVTGSGSAPDASAVRATLSEEYERVSSGLKYRDDIAQSVLSKLNEERTSNGLQALKLSAGSDVYKIARIKAADMAIYNHSDFDSPVYGDLSNLLSRFGIQSAAPSETLWRTTATKTAKDIHTRFQVQEYSRAARMSRSYTHIGIAVVEKNGYFYIAEIFI